MYNFSASNKIQTRSVSIIDGSLQLTYTPLKEPLTEIRLLQPALGRGRLQARLKTQDLKSAEGTYMTLSYCRGKRHQDLVISVDQCISRISEDPRVSYETLTMLISDAAYSNQRARGKREN